MLKRTFILLLGIIAGILGNLIAAAIQTNLWNDVFSLSRMTGSVIAIIAISLIIIALESNTLFGWSWNWHRFWYLQGLLDNPDLKKLGENFAPLQLVEGSRGISAVEVITDGKRQDLVKVLRNIIDDKADAPRTALVFGPPGSGKTTALQKLLLELTKEGVKRFGIGTPIPVFVALGNFRQGTLREFIGQSIRTSTTGRSSKVLEAHVETLIENGRVVLLLDALDEALGEHREVLLGELKELLSEPRYKKICLIVACRPREDPGERVPTRYVYEIQDLNDEAVKLLIQAFNKTEFEVEEIIDRLNKQSFLEPNAIGRNPLFLTLMVENEIFEGNRGQILNQSIDKLINREWDKPRSDRVWRPVLPKEEQIRKTKSGLAWLAYQMTENNRFRIDRDAAQLIVNRSIKEWAGSDHSQLSPEDVLGMGEEAQILVYRAEPIQFQHRQLQESLVAWKIKTDLESLERSEQAYNRATAWGDNRGWWETLSLTSGLLTLSIFDRFVRSVLGTNPKLPAPVRCYNHAGQCGFTS